MVGGIAKKNNARKRELFQLAALLVIIVSLNFIGSIFFYRFDLTSEKRFTLSDPTRDLIKKLDDIIYVKVYLDGEFPSGFRRLSNSTRELLDEFRSLSHNNIEYEFINPSESPDKKQREAVYRQLYEKGLQPTNLEVKEEAGTSQQIIFPGAIVSYKGRETTWQLLSNQLGVQPDEVLNNSVQALEYGLSSAIRTLSATVVPQIAFLEGHGELDSIDVADISMSLGEFYGVRRIAINEQIHALDGLRAIIIAQPDSAFSEKDKFIIDQYIMKGGRVLWLIDPVLTSLDSLKASGNTIALGTELKLEDQLFKYGVRYNFNLIQDLQCSAIPVNKALMGSAPRWELSPWLFYPLIMPYDNHPIIKNLDLIKLQFASTLDTISGPGVHKTILLKTSRYSRVIPAPVRVNVATTRLKPQEEQFKKSYETVAVLLEGKFESLFKNRLTGTITESEEIGFKEQGMESKMIVVSDGDIIRNEVQRSTGMAFPLGYDIYTRQTYGNKNFILNCVNYLCDDTGLLSVRAREIKLRLLNKKKANLERIKWQLISTAGPALLVVVFAIFQYFRRKKKYTAE